MFRSFPGPDRLRIAPSLVIEGGRGKPARRKGEAEMRRLIIAAAAGLMAVTIPLAANAGSARLHARLAPASGQNVQGTADWAGMSEQNPIYLSIKGATPLSEVTLRVCGPTIAVDTGTIHDQCWATFVDRDRHIMNIAVDKYGRANVALQPKLAVGSVSLLRADRVELYSADNPATPISVGKIKGWSSVFGAMPTFTDGANRRLFVAGRLRVTVRALMISLKPARAQGVE